MNLHLKAAKWLKDTNFLDEWPALNNFFKQIAELEHFGWVLCKASLLSLGGTEEDLIPLVAAYGSLQTSVLLVDDLLDEDPKGMQHEVGVGNAANMALAYQAAGIEMVNQSQFDEKLKLRIIEKLNEMMFLVALGQKMDTENWASEEKYWEIANLKSSPYSGIALEIGAIAAGADEDMIKKMRRWGEIYGEFMQISDDMKDVMAVPATDDWAGGRHPLPILYTETVNHPKRERFLELRDHVEDEEKLKEAQHIMVECGAFSYCFEQFFLRVVEARKVLEDMNLPDTSEFEKLESHMLHAPRKILEKMGVEDVESIIAGKG